MSTPTADRSTDLVPVEHPYLRPAKAAVSAGQRVTPIVLPTAVLAAARWWHDQGAAHSIGDALLSGALTVGFAVGGAICALNGDRLTRGAAIGFSAAGTFAAAGIVAYDSGLALPTLLWIAAAGVASKLAALARDSERRARRRAAQHAERKRLEDDALEQRAENAHRHRLELLREREGGKTGRAIIDAVTRIATAELDAARAVTVAEVRAGRAHAELNAGRAALPTQHGHRQLIALLTEQTPTIRVEQITDAQP